MRYFLPGRIHGVWKQCCKGVEAIADLLFPQVCAVCDNSLVTGEKYFCTSCLADFPFTYEGYDKQDEIRQRFEAVADVEAVHSLFYYNKYSSYKNLIHLVKYHSHRKLGVFLGHMLGEHIVSSCRADCIIPVPLHPEKQRQRGFNQAFEIASGVSEVLGIEVMDDVVCRIRNNVSQTGKDAYERLKNVEHIFALQKPEKITGRHVLLLDDVITTGATICSCLGVLAGAENVKFSLGCLARTM